jgi:hypothetical protein
MRDDRLVIDVSFDEQRGYVGTHADLRSPVDGPFAQRASTEDRDADASG